MTKVRTDIAGVKQLEAKLAKSKDVRQRLVIIDELAGHYVFTNYKEAQRLLAEQKEILTDNPLPDFQLLSLIHI